jgi:xanthine dehydrogenase accessory factor
MFDLAALAAAVAAHGRVARLVIAAHDGSSPREVGAAMLVWADPAQAGGQSGTIGGGALEFEATNRARALLAQGGHRLDRQALGPTLGQCCGGAVTVLTEVHDATTLPALAGQTVIARPVDGRAMPLPVKRLLAAARGKGQMPQPQLLQGWMIEPVAHPNRDIWVWGAGHVGRAMVAVLAPLPDLHLTWIDTARDRFPESIPEGVTPVWSATPEMLADHAPPGAEHLIVTYSHALDLELCHRLLTRGFGWLGLIGSETKWARFRSRLARLGHPAAQVARITCPIGDRSLGKHPQAIALGVAVQLLNNNHKSETEITDDNRDTHPTRGASPPGGPDQGLSRRGGE